MAAPTTVCSTDSPSSDSMASKTSTHPHKETMDCAELNNLKHKLSSALVQYQDFPTPGILFEDILPIFGDPTLHEMLIHALEMYCTETYGKQKPDVIAGLDARGFLFGPTLALRMGVAFVPIRKHGKMPGACKTLSYQKDYGSDRFQVQTNAIREGQHVLVVDDVIATGTLDVHVDGLRATRLMHSIGGSALAAGNLVKQLGGKMLGYLFMVELAFLKGREKLDAPSFVLLSRQQNEQAG